MRTGKQLSNYYIYSIIWANKIIAEVEDYSIDKAYAISPIFGSMVERQIADYQAQLDRLKYTAMVFGVFDECTSMFDKFFETNKKDINYLAHHPKKAEPSAYRLVYGDERGESDLAKLTHDDLIPYALEFNKMWDEKFAYVMKQIGNLSLEKTKWIPSCYANIFKEQYQIVEALTWRMQINFKRSIQGLVIYLKADKDTYNQLRFLEDYKDLLPATVKVQLSTNLTSSDDAMSKAGENMLKMDALYKKQQDDLIKAYESNMQLLEKIRREDFYD